MTPIYLGSFVSEWDQWDIWAIAFVLNLLNDKRYSWSKTNHFRSKWDWWSSNSGQKSIGPAEPIQRRPSATSSQNCATFISKHSSSTHHFPTSNPNQSEICAGIPAPRGHAPQKHTTQISIDVDGGSFHQILSSQASSDGKGGIGRHRHWPHGSEEVSNPRGCDWPWKRWTNHHHSSGKWRVQHQQFRARNEATSARYSAVQESASTGETRTEWLEE